MCVDYCLHVLCVSPQPCVTRPALTALVNEEAPVPPLFIAIVYHIPFESVAALGPSISLLPASGSPTLGMLTEMLVCVVGLLKERGRGVPC